VQETKELGRKNAQSLKRYVVKEASPTNRSLENNPEEKLGKNIEDI